jgi:hypothetical protein
MKNLTKQYEVIDATNDDNILLDKIILNTSLKDFKQFVIKYQSAKVYEIIFFDKKNEMWILNAFFNMQEMIQLFDELKNAHNRNVFPFAFDPGGWHFCLSLDESDFGAIIVNRWTDHLPEEQFLKIADSLEEFINGLKREDEI